MTLQKGHCTAVCQYLLQLSASICYSCLPYLLQDDQNQICLLLLSKAEAQALYPGEFVCTRQEGFNSEYIEYDDLGQPTEEIVANWIINNVRVAFYPHISRRHNMYLIRADYYRHTNPLYSAECLAVA